MIKYIINAISRAITFSKTEAKGSLILIFVISIAFFLSRIHSNFRKNQPVNEQDQKIFDEWIAQVEASIEIKSPDKEEDKFDKSVYLPEKTNYAKKKIERSKTPSKAIREETKILDLNTATVEELQKVKGIGPGYSKRIVKYRNILGGFSDSTQLKEVYGLKDETITELWKHFEIQSPVQSFNINSDSIKVLARHPYISYDLAKVIINYRKVHGDLKKAEDLRKIKAVDERTFLRLKPYLK